ncbi:hypothetical protein SAMN05192551_11611 [Tindallia magadiensis]|uniref:Nucleotidyltransferase domain-containing protein n=1 Tax=Tindallia magadiensis TaxID=69895 RepID=A0A1I3HTB5_9FIRM|nr:hypothetical protein [Tindallia magadiensis]SFI38984.1 hypothetical protein SAMN05192551_11611 [Tindallia magadiensis]
MFRKLSIIRKNKGEVTNGSDIDLLIDIRLRGLQLVGLMEDIRRVVNVNKEVDVLDVTHIEKDSTKEPSPCVFLLVFCPCDLGSLSFIAG